MKYIEEGRQTVGKRVQDEVVGRQFTEFDYYVDRRGIQFCQQASVQCEEAIEKADGDWRLAFARVALNASGPNAERGFQPPYDGRDASTPPRVENTIFKPSKAEKKQREVQVFDGILSQEDVQKLCPGMYIKNQTTIYENGQQVSTTTTVGFVKRK